MAFQGREAESLRWGSCCSQVRSNDCKSPPRLPVLRIIAKSPKLLARVKEHFWNHAAYTSEARAIFVGGCQRTGTTLLRVILDTHPNICCGPEANLVYRGISPLRQTGRLQNLAERYSLSLDALLHILEKSRSRAEFIDLFFATYCRAQGKPRWAEKTPSNVREIGFIFRHFPNARFVHMIRDARDVVCSLRTHPRFEFVGGQLVKLNTRHPISKCLHAWVSDVRAGLAWRSDPRYIELKYEDLVNHKQAALRRLFHFLGEPWSEQVLAFHEVHTSSRDIRHFPQNPEATKPIYSSSIGRWKCELSRGELTHIEQRAGRLLDALGYNARESC